MTNKAKKAYAAMPHGNMLFCYSPNAQDFQERLEEMQLPCGGSYPERSGGQCSAFHHEVSTQTTVIVCLGTSAFINPLHLLSCVVHEATHVKQEYMEHLGEVSPSAEFEAYTMDYIVQELLRQLEHSEGKNFTFAYSDVSIVRDANQYPDGETPEGLLE